jgi:hypothetical protein
MDGREDLDEVSERQHRSTPTSVTSATSQILHSAHLRETSFVDHRDAGELLLFCRHEGAKRGGAVLTIESHDVYLVEDFDQ